MPAAGSFGIGAFYALILEIRAGPVEAI